MTDQERIAEQGAAGRDVAAKTVAPAAGPRGAGHRVETLIRGARLMLRLQVAAAALAVAAAGFAVFAVGPIVSERQALRGQITAAMRDASRLRAVEQEVMRLQTERTGLLSRLTVAERGAARRDRGAADEARALRAEVAALRAEALARQAEIATLRRETARMESEAAILRQELQEARDRQRAETGRAEAAERDSTLCRGRLAETEAQLSGGCAPIPR